MDCRDCEKISNFDHDSIIAPFERIIKRLWILIIILVILLVGSNVAWIIYESQFETVVTHTQEVEQQVDGDGYNQFVGGDYGGD